MGRLTAGVAGVALLAAGLLAALLALGLTGRRYGRIPARARKVRRRLRALADEAAEMAASAPGGGRVALPGDDEDLARLARTVNGLLDRLEAGLDRQRRFAADASHELRTPVAGLRTRIEVALTDPDDSDLAGTLRSAMGDAERLHRIVDDLLALARFDAGAAESRGPLDLTALVRAELAARSQDRVPVSDRLQEGVHVKVNRTQMCRVLTGLLSNAERHAVERVGVEVCSDGDEAVLEVTDDGPGIASADRERVFERFTRLDAARSRTAGGSGLGLAVAREIVIAHGGRLYVGQSRQGARLVLRLPLHRGEGDGRAPARPEQEGVRPPAPAASRSRCE